MPRPPTSIAPVALVLLAIGCGGGSTEPVTPVQGTWALQVSNLEDGNAVICPTASGPITLILRRTGAQSYDGTYSGTPVECIRPEPLSPGVLIPAQGTVTEGTVNDTGAVEFVFQPTTVRFFGKITGTTMSGIVNGAMDVGGAGPGLIRILGFWDAMKQ